MSGPVNVIGPSALGLGPAKGGHFDLNPPDETVAENECFKCHDALPDDDDIGYCSRCLYQMWKAAQGLNNELVDIVTGMKVDVDAALRELQRRI